ncbi:MAG: transporter suffix domain-containing protein [Bacteroidetes bacterium]|nr:transporter suffix domain-containing protein [Bacteroidota bacterium]
MKHKFTRILGVSLIILTWIIWGMIFILPFFKLTLAQYAIAYPVLLAATNIFWIGAALVGKELIQKYNLLSKVKSWFKRLRK